MAAEATPTPDLASVAAAAWNTAKGVEPDAPLSDEPGEFVMGDDLGTGDEPVVEEPEGDEAPEGEEAELAEGEEAEVPAADDKKVKKDETPEDKVEAAKKAAAEKAKKAKDDEDDFDSIPEKDKDGRTNRIPHPRVKKMVGKAVEKAQVEWDGKVATPLRDENRTYTERLGRVETVEKIMFGDAERFVGILKTIKDEKTGQPIYAKFFGADGQPAAGAAAVVEPSDALKALGAKPEPDGENTDGTKGYTPEGFAKLIEWVQKDATIRATDAAIKASEEKFGKRLEPWEKAAAEREADEAWSKKTAATLDDARKWPGFEEHADEILKALQDDKELKLDLPAAYRQIVFEKNRLSEDAMRKKILAEMKRAPRGTATGAKARSAAAAAAAANDEPRSLEDVAREAARAAGVL